MIFKDLLFIVEDKANIKFWRTKHGSEINFVLDQERLSAWEVKSGEVSPSPSGLCSFFCVIIHRQRPM